VFLGKEVIKRWGNIRDSYVKSCKKKKEATKSSAGSSKARKYVYSDQLTFLSKLMDERQTADSVSVDIMEESQVTTDERNGDDLNFSQETPSRKSRTQ
jgi:phenylalanyl-tRNA synthetase alpha subunit